MKVHYKSANGRLTFELEGQGVKEIWDGISDIQDCFESPVAQKCGLCGGTDLRFRHRKVDRFDYREISCTAQGCRGKLEFGQTQEGGRLFARRKDEAGNFIPNNGWVKWDPNKSKPGKDPAEPVPF